jgi:nucleotide-binding universal stress UspA family protein
MAGFTHILCPVDGSEVAARALRCAATLARQNRAALTVLSAQPPQPAMGIWTAPNLLLPPEMPGARGQSLAAFQQHVQRTTDSRDIRLLLRNKPAVAEILHEAREWPADLIVIAHVVEQFLDEHPQFARHFDTGDCFRQAEPGLRAWYSARVPAEAHATCQMRLELRRGKASQALLPLAREHQADLIAVGTASAVSMFGSTAHTIVRAADVPVLVVPPRPTLMN